MSQNLTRCFGIGLKKDGENNQRDHPYRGANLFDDNNYRALLDRLNNGKVFSFSDLI